MIPLASVALFGAALSVGITTLPGADDADTLLAKHRAFMGWRAGDGTFTSWRLSGKDVVEIRRGYQFRETTTHGHLMTDEGFTGRVFWFANENGNVVRYYDDDAERAISQDAFRAEATTLLHGTVRPDAFVGSKRVKVVRVQPTGGVPIDLYIDPDTGAYVQATFEPDHDPFTEHIDGYLDAGSGKKVVGSYHFGNRDIVVVDKFQPNAPVTDADLHPPVSRQHWTFVDGDSVPLNMTTSSNAGQAVRVAASMDGTSGLFLFDSGASGIVLYKAYADRLGLEDYGETNFEGVAGNIMRAHYALVKDIAIGADVLHNSIITVSEDTPRDGIDGIIGYDMLANAIVDVNLGSSRLTILDPDKYDPTIGKGAYAFDVDLGSGQPRVRATAGGFPFRPIIDTGDDYAVIISDALRGPGKLAPINDTISVNGQQVDTHLVFSGVDGKTDSLDCARLGTIAVGPYKYERALSCFGSPRVWGDDGGLIGFDFLRHFDWTFDYPAGKLVLTPNGS